MTGGGRTNTWDGQNRLTQCVFNGTTTTHTYGSDGLRRRTVEGATTTDYVLDGQGVVRALVNNGVDRTYLHGARGPEYERIGANDPLWYLYDGLGSVLGTVDQNGTVVSTRKYDVYGAVRGSTGPGGTKHKFVGSLGHPSEDETGLVYMRARYYDPVAGRFASEDPGKDGTNWFQYGNSNPLRYVDADGRFASLVCVMFAVSLVNLFRTGETPKITIPGWLISGLVWGDIGVASGWLTGVRSPEILLALWALGFIGGSVGGWEGFAQKLSGGGKGGGSGPGGGAAAMIGFGLALREIAFEILQEG